MITDQNEEKLTKSVCWESNSDDSDHLYELIRGVPTVIVSNDRTTTTTDFIPKRDLIEPKSLIGSKNLKNRKNSFFGSSFLSDKGKNVQNG